MTHYLHISLTSLNLSFFMEADHLDDVKHTLRTLNLLQNNVLMLLESVLNDATSVKELLARYNDVCDETLGLWRWQNSTLNEDDLPFITLLGNSDLNPVSDGPNSSSHESVTISETHPLLKLPDQIGLSDMTSALSAVSPDIDVSVALCGVYYYHLRTQVVVVPESLPDGQLIFTLRPFSSIEQALAAQGMYEADDDH